MKEAQYYSSPDRLAKLARPFTEPKAPLGPAEGTFDQRQQARKLDSDLQHEIAKQVEEKAKKSQSVRNPFAQRVAELKKQLKYAASHEKPALERKLEMFTEQAELVDKELAASDLKAAFEASSEIKNLKEHSGALERSHKISHPDVAIADVALVLAIARFDAFATPSAKANEYWKAVSALESKQVAAEEVKMQAATTKAHAVSTEYREQKQRLEQSQANLEVVKQRMEAKPGD